MWIRFNHYCQDMLKPMKMKNKYTLQLAFMLAIASSVGGNAHAQCAPDLVSPNPVFLSDATAECFITVPAPTTTDFCDGIVSGTTTDPVSYSSEGAYVINWTFTDAAGNSVSAPQNVIIDDITNPVPSLALLPDVLSECAVFALTAPMASDNCGGTIVGFTGTTFPITATGTTVVTWTFDDNRGNVVTQTQNVIIDDVTAPVPDIAALPNVTGQ